MTSQTSTITPTPLFSSPTQRFPRGTWESRFVGFMGIALTVLVALAFSTLAASAPAGTHASTCGGTGVTSQDRC